MSPVLVLTWKVSFWFAYQTVFFLPPNLSSPSKLLSQNGYIPSPTKFLLRMCCC